MKVNSSIIVSFAVGAILASLPYTLSGHKTVAQGAGPISQGQGFPQGQGNPASLPGQSFPGQNPPGQGRQGGPQMVNTMTTSGAWLFAAAGDTIYKIDINSMQVIGQTRLQPPRPQNPGLGRGGSPRPGNGGGNIPPNEK